VFLLRENLRGSCSALRDWIVEEMAGLSDMGQNTRFHSAGNTLALAVGEAVALLPRLAASGSQPKADATEVYTL